MESESKERLLRRIARLVRQNKELEEQVKKLEREKERLLETTEKYRLLVENNELKGVRVEEEDKSLKFNMVTVLFASIQGFPNMTEEIDPALMMDELDEIFFEFDRIIRKYHVEKIRTIGDTYMCAGGIPAKNITNPVEVVMAAVELRQFLRDFEAARRGEKRIWNLKIGIHTGPVSATVSGKSRVSYDIKGRAVNTASRIQGVSEKDSILISVMTYELIKEFFNCDYYGKLPVKYMGNIQMYQVAGLLPELAADSNGAVPNKSFKVKFGLIQLTDIQEVVLDKLEKELPDFLFYHNVKHTVDVVTEVELIGWAEGCTDEEILLLKTAALFHDAGHTVSYDDHEYHGTLLVKEMLPAYGYSEEQLEKICRIIMSTKLPPKPGDLLEQIICDSDLDYLGRSDFIPVSNTLYEELKAQDKITNLNDWNKMQVKFISGHQYFTATARQLREVNKKLQIERIRSLITES
ncbi:MAG TPA: adenylate/guanylate cyclase domain-containing protein [Bacteroidales bacterium]|jgi:class 3 adenylate cyclase/predicted metal-dependent HD superfamily phosphohydrolase|nr:HD domain-containing protein [Bacteroidales bacterium]OPZ57850.1 MAG: Adenylate cyclase [Bacteroidetes bacterium ADurb.BinA012]HNV67285.1 adenylate/guanylate cyclase domain-containing protein [Bacteroidales bacterium]HNY58472.1 adenylate/guanylate cyclase domain-containing protein [Bacteroidales bacterium]HOC05024.1 adenylate/guanylate cyclase domain-containing protein [Bacteroidales bacterium]